MFAQLWPPLGPTANCISKSPRDYDLWQLRLRFLRFSIAPPVGCWWGSACRGSPRPPGLLLVRQPSQADPRRPREHCRPLQPRPELCPGPSAFQETRALSVRLARPVFDLLRQICGGDLIGPEEDDPSRITATKRRNLLYRRSRHRFPDYFTFAIYPP